MANKSRTYILTYHWAGDAKTTMTHELNATTVPRACAKLHKELSEEYEYPKADLVIIGCVEM